MAWRFVKQPNGLLARFSDIVDDFTHIGLTLEDAIELCIDEHGMTAEQAEQKVWAGLEDHRPWTKGVVGNGRERWLAALSSIRAVHGDDKVLEVERQVLGAGSHAT